MTAQPLSPRSHGAPSGKVGSSPLSTARGLFDLTFVMGVNGFLLWFFYNRFWYAPDEGNYAHVAQRLLNGEILNLQIQDVHPGYINFVNAAALSLFGADLLSLRYPLVLISFGLSILIFLLFYQSGRHKVAAVASLAMTALGVIQFLNPTSNWYCLFLVVLIACSLNRIHRKATSRLFIVGFLLGTLVLFRQLSGVLVSMGVVTYLLLEGGEDPGEGQSRVLARSLIGLMAAGLAWYLLGATDAIGLVLFGFCPFVLLIWLCVYTTVDNRQVLRTIASLSIGGIIAAVPLVLYHLLHGSLGPWLNDTVVNAVNLTKLSFINEKMYGKLVTAGLSQLFRGGSTAEHLNGFYWAVLPVLAFLNGIVLLRFLTRNSALTRSSFALPILAVFYAVVSVHYQIPIYLYYTVGLSIAGLLWMIPRDSRLTYGMAPAVLLLSGIAVYYHAAQPISGTNRIFGGERTISTLSKDSYTLTRSRLKIESDDRLRYFNLLRLIETETRPEETIFAVPSNAELYFLSGRRNPFRFYNSALGIRNEGELQQVRETILNQPPKLVVYKPNDKYNTNYSREIISLIKERYIFLGETSGFEIYRARQRSDNGNHLSKSYVDTPAL